MKDCSCHTGGCKYHFVRILVVTITWRNERARDALNMKVLSHKTEGDQYIDIHDQHMLKWNQTVKLSKHNKFVYEVGNIRVKSSGYYYIYSQLTYQDYSESSPYSDNAIMSDYWGKNSSTTSYTRDVLYLKENDLIQVRVLHPPKLLPSEHSNYFGMYLT
ncbi:hypothetical protein ACJMK2_018200 [Sinanodonta woodiana]|uniref:THD domain-containing protein n=1 Tax=Sinanodonta woodiana TaxID=1069815 RepID=A0ABD3UCR1_SINWO